MTNPEPTPDLAFDPVAVRPRHDGWTPERQLDFIGALAESGCVKEAAARIGVSATAAYNLRRQPGAQSFRMAWEAALDQAVQRLSDAAFARAIHGVSRPVFFQGEQVGERVYYDERLTQFILRYRDPVRYGAWLDGVRVERHADGPAISLARWTNQLADDAWADEIGEPRERSRGPLLRQYHDLETPAPATPQRPETPEEHAERVKALCATLDTRLREFSPEYDAERQAEIDRWNDDAAWEDDDAGEGGTDHM